MARPRIGFVGALVAVGGVIAWRWAQKHRASQARLVTELSRWEDEGGALASTTQAAPTTTSPPASAAATATTAGGTRDAWIFPHG